MSKKITEQRYFNARSDHEGFCTVCKYFTREETEPDAEGYECLCCEKNTVIGIEVALITGEIEIELDDSI